MSDLRRLVETDDVAPEVLELIRSARPARPLDSSTKERSRRRIARVLVVPAAAGAFFWLQPAALGAVLGAAVTGVIVATRVVPGEAPPPAAVSEGPARTAAVQPSAPVAAAPAAGEPAETIPSAPALHKHQAPQARPESGQDTLAREAKMLERARALLVADAQAALFTLVRHEKEFAEGALAIERELLTVDALMRLGRRAEAEARARALRGRTPGSLYERRLDELLGGSR